MPGPSNFKPPKGVKEKKGPKDRDLNTFEYDKDDELRQIIKPQIKDKEKDKRAHSLWVDKKSI